MAWARSEIPTRIQGNFCLIRKEPCVRNLNNSEHAYPPNNQADFAFQSDAKRDQYYSHKPGQPLTNYSGMHISSYQDSAVRNTSGPQANQLLHQYLAKNTM